MTVEEISKLVGNGGKPPEGNSVERCLYWELRDAYIRFKNGSIGRTEGERIKAEAVERFKKENDELVYAKRFLDHHAKMWREIEAATSRYNKEPSIESADAVIKALYRVERKEMKKDG